MGSEEVSFGSAGTRCAARLFRPPAAAGPAPCIVMGSGLSCVRDQRLEAFAERFAAAGVAALAFDYRHFGESGGEPRQLMSDARQREDFRAALAFARADEGVDASRVALWGFSLGGGHVQALAMREPGIAATICVAPVIDGLRSLLYIGGPSHVARLGLAGLRDLARALRGAEPYRVPAAGPPDSLAILNSRGSLPGFEAVTAPGSSWRNELCARAALAPPYRLARKTRSIPAPILYCLTEEDDINPPALGKLAAGRAPRAELRLYPGGHFDPFLGRTFERMAADQAEFLARHLLG
ncbi:MAG TPA: alpha/beta hydrolase [Solirubrobacterales bacterium]|nr:alpha/beta hydrolase [Solirubrobacterales bacterium]